MQDPFRPNNNRPSRPYGRGPAADRATFNNVAVDSEKSAHAGVARVEVAGDALASTRRRTRKTRRDNDQDAAGGELST